MRDDPFKQRENPMFLNVKRIDTYMLLICLSHEILTVI